MIAQAMANGMAVSAIYVMLTVGLVLIFSVLKIANFAHGDLMILAAYLSFVLVTVLGLGWPLAVLLAAVSMGLVGTVVYTIVLRPLVGRPEMNQFVVTFALGVLLQAVVQVAWGTEFKTIYVDFPTLTLAGVSVYAPNALAAVVALAMLPALEWILRGTRIGMLVRSSAQNPQGAELIGIDIRRVYLGVFVLGCILLTLGGAVLAVIYPLSPTLGADFTFKAFLIAILAGIGNIRGAGIVAVGVGMVESVVGTYANASIAQLVTYGLVIALLLARPQGVFRGELA